MISEALSSIQNVQVYPIVTMLLFMISFVGIVIWTFRLRKHEVARLSRLPLDDAPTPDNQGEQTHG